MTVYLDSSALVKLVADEAESAALLDWLSARPSRATSMLALAEVPRAVMRRPVPDVSRIDAVLTRVAIVGLTSDIARRAAPLLPASLRSLDAIHLASALELGSELEAVVTYDERMAEAAHAAGLEVVSPGRP